MGNTPAYRGRIRLLAVLAVFGFSLLLVRLFFIQVVQAEYYADKADRQYQRPLAEAPNRGTIYFKERDGQLVSAATMQQGFLLAIEPAKITNAADVYSKLSAITTLDQESFFKKAAKLTDPYEEIAPRLAPEQAKQIEALKLPGVQLYKTRWRFYPAGRSAAHVLGFMGYEGDEYAGRYGLEKFYNTALVRETSPGFVNFLARTLSEFSGSVLGKGEGESSGDLVLTIEPTVQKTLEEELANVRAKYQADALGGVIINPKTGATYAMAALPDFDPGARQESIAYLANPLVERVFEMGSIVKALTMASALDAGAVKSTSTYRDDGFLVLNGRRIQNYDGRARGVVSMQEVLNQSLNTGAVYAMQKLGTENFKNYLKRFGLGVTTGIDLPGEISGLLSNLEQNREINFATASYGQGIAVTPIEIVRALAALGNGGYLVQPHVVSEVISDQTKLSHPVVLPETHPQVIKPETSHEISRMLVEVVDTKLAGGRAKLPNYSVAAKTGTAQMSDPEGGYYTDRYFHSFFGYFPAYDPEFLVFLYVQNPQGVNYASETLTEPFMNLTKFLLNYYHVPPDRTPLP